MAEKLWFLYEDGNLIEVFNDKESVVEVREELRSINEDSKYTIKAIPVAELREETEIYAEEWDLALDNNYI
jgi:hypothetical protein